MIVQKTQNRFAPLMKHNNSQEQKKVKSKEDDDSSSGIFFIQNTEINYIIEEGKENTEGFVSINDDNEFLDKKKPVSLFKKILSFLKKKE